MIRGYNKEYIIDTMNEYRYDLNMIESYVNMICDTLRIPSFHKGKEEHLIMYLNQNRRGVVPQILERLKKEREECKKLSKKYGKEGDPILETIYDQRQNAIKILMNSIYGIYGTQEGNFGFMEGSAAANSLWQVLHRESQ